ncbi:MAG: alpha-xylosidase [Bifidobacteriaceae bacterium]|jgi:alpha-D-xyloside xylohydrolase|nr:alpha-xylosidase [Bifidobacteriaceae bacterium]MCI1978321.1 alpha-xylosidase [Bifidobacteriaceae bacterium]
MKFTNGYWLSKPNVDAIFARETYEVETAEEDSALTVLATSKFIGDRADTLNLPTFDFRITSPGEGIIRVQARHWDGAEEDPGFPFPGESEKPAGKAAVSPDGVGSLTSGPLTATVSDKEPWNLVFSAGGKVLTELGNKSISRYKLNELSPVTSEPSGQFAPTESGRAYDESQVFTSAQLGLSVGEYVYGFGERFGTFVKNGQSIDTWNMDGGTSSEQGYKDIPFYMTTGGYGVLVNNRGHVSFEVGSENVETVQFAVPGEYLDFLVFYGPTPKDVLRRYTGLVGRPAQVPAWSYGLWLTTSFTTKYDEKTIASMVDGMSERGIPLSAFHYDSFWMREFRWTDFEWDSRHFTDPTSTLKKLHDEKGLHLCAWINPYIAQRGSMFAEAKEHGYLVRKPTGEIWQTDLWQAGMGLVDFTNPEATAWYQGKIRHLLEQGIDCIKTDFGERIPTDVVWYDGSNPQAMHNWYTQLYNSAVFHVLEEVKGKGQAVLYARSATVGGQQQPIHWGGDCESTFNGMAQTLRGGLSLASSGFGFWSHDIGGFEGKYPDPALYKRWTAFGLLGSHSRYHGSTVYRVPWLFDEEDAKNGVTNPPGQSAVEVARKFTHLKLDLMPYLYQVGLEPHECGTPVMRSMVMEFPDDPATYTLDRQYMFGPSLLVAPVFTRSGEVQYYLPAGTWVNYFTGEKVRGGAWRTETHAYDSVPLWVRDNTVLVTNPGHDTPEYTYADSAVVSVFLDEGESAEAVVTEADGSSTVFRAEKTADGIKVTSSTGVDFTARLGVGDGVKSTEGVAYVR